MNEHFSKRYEEELENIKGALHKKGGTKKLEKVWERIGRLKERYPTANKHYTISVTSDAYQVVATIRYQLRAKNIHHDWRNIVRIMNT